MTYQPSQTLIDILLSYGFKECTATHSLKNWKRLQDNDFCFSKSIERHFIVGRLKVVFRFENICLHYKNHEFYRQARKLPESELRSLLLFTKLSTTDRAYLNRHNIYPSNIAKHVAKYSTEDREYLRVNTRAKIEYFEEALKKITI